MATPEHQSYIQTYNNVFVEMEGIMEMRYSSEDCDHKMEPEDMFTFQSRVNLENVVFCKDKKSTRQQFVYCIVCNCELYNRKVVEDHVLGKKHIKKAYEKKRQVLGLLKEPPNATRKKEHKTKRPLIDVGETLEEKLKNCGSWSGVHFRV